MGTVRCSMSLRKCWMALGRFDGIRKVLDGLGKVSEARRRCQMASERY